MESIGTSGTPALSYHETARVSGIVHRKQRPVRPTPFSSGSRSSLVLMVQPSDATSRCDGDTTTGRSTRVLLIRKPGTADDVGFRQQALLQFLYDLSNRRTLL